MDKPLPPIVPVQPDTLLALARSFALPLSARAVWIAKNKGTSNLFTGKGETDSLEKFRAHVRSFGNAERDYAAIFVLDTIPETDEELYDIVMVDGCRFSEVRASEVRDTLSSHSGPLKSITKTDC
jgi:hypothetical protein